MTEIDLDRFFKAQENTWRMARQELQNGKKKTHWIWWIFPECDHDALGTSETTKKYQIHSLEEADEYFGDILLGSRLTKCAQALLDSGKDNIKDIVYWPDDLKIKSSMTLFEEVVKRANRSDDEFTKVLEKYFDGERCEYTLEWIADQIQA